MYIWERECRIFGTYHFGGRSKGRPTQEQSNARLAKTYQCNGIMRLSGTYELLSKICIRLRDYRLTTHVDDHQRPICMNGRGGKPLKN